MGDGTAPSVGAFDIDISYDNSILEFQSLVFGDRLALSGTNSFQESSVMMPNTINLVEVSTNTSQELDIIASSSFLTQAST